MELKEGVYVGQTGKLKLLSKNEKGLWELEEGIKKQHPFFRITMYIVKTASPGWPFFDYELKNYEYLGEL